MKFIKPHEIKGNRHYRCGIQEGISITIIDLATLARKMAIEGRYRQFCEVLTDPESVLNLLMDAIEEEC